MVNSCNSQTQVRRTAAKVTASLLAHLSRAGEAGVRQHWFLLGFFLENNPSPRWVAWLWHLSLFLPGTTTGQDVRLLFFFVGLFKARRAAWQCSPPNFYHLSSSWRTTQSQTSVSLLPLFFTLRQAIALMDGQRYLPGENTSLDSLWQTFKHQYHLQCLQSVLESPLYWFISGSSMIPTET